MFRGIIALVVAFIVAGAAAWSQSIDPPTLTPVPSTSEQRRLINEGIDRHDRGEYDSAIAKYQQVLDENPDNVTALYELAYSYSMKGDLDKTLDAAYTGARYKSENLGGFYMMIGNTLDQQGKSKKAIAVYKSAIKLFPDDPMLYFNLGITYSRLDESKDARENLKKALYLNPNHPGSHNALSVVYAQYGYKTPALLATLRFLALEPTTDRSTLAFDRVYKLLHHGVSKDPDADKTTITVNVDERAAKDEGDFTAIDMMIGLSAAAKLTDKNKGASEMEMFIDQIKMLMAVLSVPPESDADNEKFVRAYYIPYFNDLQKQGHTETFCYYIAQTSDMEGVQEWLEKNRDKVLAFLVWSRGYEWPTE